MKIPHRTQSALVAAFWALLMTAACCVGGGTRDQAPGRRHLVPEMSPDAIEVKWREEFRRDSSAVDPVGGRTVGPGVPLSSTMEVPDWNAAPPLSILAEERAVLGVSRDGRLFETEPRAGQGRLELGTIDGSRHTVLGDLPVANQEDYPYRVMPVAFGTNELVFASMRQSGLYLVRGEGQGVSANLLPDFCRPFASKLAFNGNLIVEAVDGRAPAECRLLLCLYGQRIEALSEGMGNVFVLRSRATLREIAGGGNPDFRLAWRQDAFDYFRNRVPGSIVVSDQGGIRTGTAAGLTTSGDALAKVDLHRPNQIRIMAGTGAGQCRIVARCSSNELSVLTPWEVVPDSSSRFEIVAAGKPGSGMHLHCAGWTPRCRNGETNVLFLSFGDGAAGHVCRITNFDQLPDADPVEDRTGKGLHYSDSMVFAVGHQPTGIWVDGKGSVYFLARDSDGTVVRSADDVFQPELWSGGRLVSRNPTDTGVGYDSYVTADGVAMLATLTEGLPGNYGVFFGRLGVEGGLFRAARRYNVLHGKRYVGFSMLHANPLSDVIAASCDPFEPATPHEVVVGHRPQFRSVRAVLVGNAGTNRIGNASFESSDGKTPNGWYRTPRTSEAIQLEGGPNGFGEGRCASVRLDGPNASASLRLDRTIREWPTGLPLHVSFAFRQVEAIDTIYTAPVSMTLNWLQDGKTLKLATSGGFRPDSVGQWLWFQDGLTPPPGADAVQVGFSFRGYRGAVEVACPSLSVGEPTLPTSTSRAADRLEYVVNAAHYGSRTNVSIEFLVMPLWAGHQSIDAPHTIATIQAADGRRLELTCNARKGVEAVVWESRAFSRLEVGLTEEISASDLLRFTVEWAAGAVAVRAVSSTGVSVSEARLSSAAPFLPTRMRLGGDLVSDEAPGWEGYYALLGCHAWN